MKHTWPTSLAALLLFAVSNLTFAQDSPSDAVASIRGVQALETRAVFYP